MYHNVIVFSNWEVFFARFDLWETKSMWEGKEGLNKGQEESSNNPCQTVQDFVWSGVLWSYYCSLYVTMVPWCKHLLPVSAPGLFQLLWNKNFQGAWWDSLVTNEYQN